MLLKNEQRIQSNQKEPNVISVNEKYNCCNLKKKTQKNPKCIRHA